MSNQKNSYPFWLILPFLIVATYFLILNDKRPKKESKKVISKVKERKTSDKAKKDFGFEPSIQETNSFVESDSNTLSLQKDRRFQDVYTDLDAKAFDKQDSLPNLDDQIAFEMKQEAWWKEYQDKKSKAQKRSFVKQFLQNAREAGYKVTLDTDLNVVQIEKIKKETPEPIFKE